MKAVGFTQSLPIQDPQSFFNFKAEKPEPGPHELLIKIKAVSVNPVDYKVRQSAAKQKELEEPKIIGWDACGIVEKVGEGVSHFIAGDKLFYAGDLTKPGCYAEYQVVDERIAAKSPENQSWEEIAAIPLTGLTAWECIFDRMKIEEGDGEGKTILIIGGAGGVGSIAIQLLKALTNFKVVATASRDETTAWCKKMGADKVIGHNALAKELENNSIDYILNFADTSGYWQTMANLIKPQGGICAIVNTTEPVDINLLKNKSVSFHWELMFTRSRYQTADMEAQHKILASIAWLMENNKIKSTLHKKFEGLEAETFKKVHELQESGKSIGKNVIVY
ncbi:zinc-binding alcohol dehydrogenase family protein [Christiangramia fulva]|uniref:Zinc-type alcohol dehydrogenase-like protein n=1 Tax=Christiangramia fulva TaxID=2126553 RepID=A0A2R3Z7Z5_9FLAO|nr:zinc-binding alcohol dehydrogenase family protein [Christiangramia fulva]AVR46342.1 zinc-binding alcohol dehydrogenase family protein [Christiangramia fulva]